MKKGDIWLVEIPPTQGHEQSGYRPFIALTDTIVNICVAIPITSTKTASRLPFTFTIKPSLINGLDKESVALAFNIRAIDKKRFRKPLGVIEDASEINGILKSMLAIN